MMLRRDWRFSDGCAGVILFVFCFIITLVLRVRRRGIQFSFSFLLGSSPSDHGRWVVYIGTDGQGMDGWMDRMGGKMDLTSAHGDFFHLFFFQIEMR
jgi:hypothetical protein